jgi:hypothetical protein
MVFANYKVDFVKLQQQVDSSDDSGDALAKNDNRFWGGLLDGV